MVDSIKSLTKNLEVPRSNSGKASNTGGSGPVVSPSKVVGGSTGVGAGPSGQGYSSFHRSV